MRICLSLASLTMVTVISASCSTTTQGRIPSLRQLQKTQPTRDCTIKFWEDGDTPTVLCGKPEKEIVVRMIGIDTAESGFDDNSRRRGKKQTRLWAMSIEQVFACGKAATKRVREFCPNGSRVQVVGGERGKYGRLLGYIICKGTNMNEMLVKEGLAGRYPYPDPPSKPTRCPLH